MVEKPLTLDELRALQAQRKTLDDKVKAEEGVRNRQASKIGWVFLEHFETNPDDGITRTCIELLHRKLKEPKDRATAGIHALMQMVKDARAEGDSGAVAAAVMGRKA